jgi:general secretion pathway protein C
MTKFYTTLFNVIVITFILFFAVDIFYTTIRKRLQPPLSSKAVMHFALSAEEQPKPKIDTFRIISDKSIFGPFEVVEDKGEISDESVEELAQTSLNLVLLGTVAGDPVNAMAVIEDPTKRRQDIYKVGDSLQGAVIRRILREKVVVNTGDRDEVLIMERESRPQTGTAEPRTEATRDSDTITVNRADVQRSFQDINQLLTQVRIRPHFTAGKADGLAIARIKAGSIFSRLGLRNGDIIQGIDNEPIQNPDDILALYEKLESKSTISLQIKRRGKEKTITYNFR